MNRKLPLHRSRCIACLVGMLGVVAGSPIQADNSVDAAVRSPRFCKTGTNATENFAAASATHVFDVVNSSASSAGGAHVLVVFERNTHAVISPCILRLAPVNGRP